MKAIKRPHSGLNSKLNDLTLTYNEETDCFGMINPFTNEWKDVVRAFFKETPLIPVMTSNTDASGITISASSKIQEPYTAFDNIDDTRWHTNYTASGWLMVKFDKPKIATKFVIFPLDGGNITGTFKIQGSNNGTNFTDLVNPFAYTGVEQTLEAIDKNQYNYYRVYISGASINQTQGITPGVKYWQIYGQDVV